MAESHWKGMISFGLVNIPIILVNSSDHSDKIVFHQIDKTNHARIKYLRVNADTGKEVPWKNIIKAYEYDKDTILPVDEDELHYVAGESARSIEIEKFIDADNIDFIHIDKTYFLVPDKKGEKGYVILREALKKTSKLGIAKVIISTKEHLAAIACSHNALVLYLLKYHSEIKTCESLELPSEDIKKVKATTKEIDIAKKLIASMSGKWQPEKYKDQFAEIVHKWAEKKIKKGAFHKAKNTVKKKVSNVVDFVDLLRKSMAKKKSK